MMAPNTIQQGHPSNGLIRSGREGKFQATKSRGELGRGRARLPYLSILPVKTVTAFLLAALAFLSLLKALC